MNKGVKDLIADISLICVKNSISFRLENKHLVDEENLPCSGYFDEESLVVATKKANQMEWVSTLLHESCHMDQYLKKSKYYIKDSVGLTIVEGWLGKKRISRHKALMGFKNTILLELDCEKRTVKKIKRYKLPINISRYIQEANAYIFSYIFALEEKRWYKAPYEDKKIVNVMPKKFLTLDQYFKDYKNYKNYFTKRA